jgi:hypothetical protein
MERNTVELQLSQNQSTGLSVIRMDVAIVLCSSGIDLRPPPTPKTAYRLQKPLLESFISTVMNFNTINQRCFTCIPITPHVFIFILALTYFIHNCPNY